MFDEGLVSDEVMKMETEYGHRFCITNDKVLGMINMVPFIAVPENFNELYSNFLKNNKKSFSRLSMFSLESNNVAKYLFCLCSDAPNTFLWALNCAYKCSLSPIAIQAITWNDNYGQLAKNLKKGTITAYNDDAKLLQLDKEMRNLRKAKRINDSVSLFNTTQKKLLKGVTFSSKQEDTLNLFSALSDTKKRNFVRKMSTIESVEDIFHQMSLLCAEHFSWSKDSLLEFIENAPHINCDIVLNRDNILLVKVNDYDTVKHLTRATNWCITKNKKYWNQYMGDGNKQYVLFDFSKAEDEDLSIVGFTVTMGSRISSAHSFTNRDLAQKDYPVNLVPFVQMSNSIHSILKRHNIDSSIFLGNVTYAYEWSKDGFMKALDEATNGKYEILNETDEKVVVSAKYINLAGMWGETQCKEDALMEAEDFSGNKKILFAKFSNTVAGKRLMTCFIKTDNRRCKEQCVAIFDEFLSTNPSSMFDRLLAEYGLPYDIICRPTSTSRGIVEAIEGFDGEAIAGLIANGSYPHPTSSEFRPVADMLNQYLVHSLTTYYSFTFIDGLLKNGVILKDAIGKTRMSQLCCLMANIMFREGTRIRHLPLEDEEEKVLGEGQVNSARFIFAKRVLKMLIRHCSDENIAVDIYETAVCECPSFNKYIDVLLECFMPLVDFKKDNTASACVLNMISRSGKTELVKKIIEGKEIASSVAKKIEHMFGACVLAESVSC